MQIFYVYAWIYFHKSNDILMTWIKSDYKPMLGSQLESYNRGKWFKLKGKT